MYIKRKNGNKKILSFFETILTGKFFVDVAKMRMNHHRFRFGINIFANPLLQTGLKLTSNSQEKLFLKNLNSQCLATRTWLCNGDWSLKSIIQKFIECKREILLYVDRASKGASAC